MKNNIDQAIKEQFSQASLKELMPDFDEELMLQAIHRKIEVKRKGSLSKINFKYAAVLVAGFLMAHLINAFRNDVAQENRQLIAIRQLTAAPAVVALPSVDTIIVPAAYASTKIKKKGSYPEEHRQEEKDSAVGATVVALPPEDTSPDLVVQEPLKVKHFYDLEINQATQEKNDSYVVKRKKSLFKSKQKAAPHPDEVEELPIRSLFYALQK